MGTEENNVYLIDGSVKPVSGTKRQIAIEIMDKVEEIMRN